MTSVCMATYNGARFIKEQVDSILPQLGANDELIVSDDGSTDGTLEILAEYAAADGRVKVLHHEKNPKYSGHEKATANFENALRHSSGDRIFLSDQDDVWLPEKVSVCLKYLKDFDFVCHGMNRIDELGNANQFECVAEIPKNWIFNIMNMKLRGCCFAFSRDVLDACLPFPQKLVGHEYWISAIAIRFFRAFTIRQPLINYREHSMSVSQGKKTSLLYKVSYRMKLFLSVAGRIQRLNKTGGRL